MRILILNPPYRTPVIREGRCQSPQDIRRNSIPQMTIAYLSGILEREGHELKVYDCIASSIHKEELFQDLRLNSFVPELALINTTTPTINSDLIFIQNFKERYPASITAVFGTHVTILHKEIMDANPSLDIAIRNEPEGVVTNIINRINSGYISGEIKGCTVRINGKVEAYPQQESQENLDSYGYPAWEYLPIDRYIHPIFNKPYLMINTSRGCVHRCIFCVAPKYYGQKVRHRSIETIIKEIRMQITNFSIRHFWFYADDFTHDPKFVRELCESIIEARFNIIWWSNTRVDKLDEEMFTLMKKSGCRMLSIGGESGNQEILKRTKKDTELEHIKKAVRLLKKIGIDSLVYFLIGLPGETNKTIKETIKFAKEINPDYVEFYPAIPYPGTEFYDIAVKEKMLAETDWDKYQCGGIEFIVEILGVKKKELEEMLRKAYREFYFRPTYARFLMRRVIHPKEFSRLVLFGCGYLKRFLNKRIDHDLHLTSHL